MVIPPRIACTLKESSLPPSNVAAVTARKKAESAQKNPLRVKSKLVILCFQVVLKASRHRDTHASSVTTGTERVGVGSSGVSSTAIESTKAIAKAMSKVAPIVSPV